MKASFHSFSAEDAEVLSLFAAQAAIAIENARLFESQCQRAEEIQGLANVVRRINSTLDLKRVLEVIAMQAAELSCSDAGAVFELEDERQMLGLTAAYNISPAFVKAVNASGVRLGEGAVGKAAAEREPYQMAELSNVPDFPFRERLVAEGFQSILAVPMLRGEALLGGIVLIRREPGAFSSHVVDLVGTLAEHGAIAVDNARLHQQVKDHAEQLEGLVRERTAELEAQHAEIEAIMENVTEGIVVTDVEGDIIHANPVAETLLRRERSSREARELSAIIHDLVRKADEQPKRMVELEDIDLELQAAPIAEPGLKEAAAVVALHDVTHLKELDRMKSRFVSNVSHELRTPIATIKLLGDLMRQQPERWREYLDLLIQEADQQAELVEHILDISRIDCDRLEMSLRPTSVTELVEQQVKARQATAGEKQLTLRHCPSNGRLLTTADPQRMKQVLNNLLSNAIRYTRAGGEITVSTGIEEAQGRPWITVTVTDTGIGIPRDELPHLFERFYRGQLPRRMEIPGTGLGLSIVREIVRLHGGRVTVESEVGEGSAFTVWLPPCEEKAPS
jgi:signal transduction histidine kinase